MKIDQKPKATIKEPKVGQQLNRCDSRDPLDRLQFDNQTVFNKKVDLVGTIQLNTLVQKRDGNLSLQPQTTKAQFLTNTFFVRRLEQSRPQRTMNLQCRPDYDKR